LFAFTQQVSPMRRIGSAGNSCGVDQRRCVMSVHAHIPARASLPLRVGRRATFGAVPSQVSWLVGGLVLAFGVPFVLADLADLQRDLYYALYVAAVLDRKSTRLNS